MKKILLLLLLNGATFYRLSAQSNCTQTLRTARVTYDQGKLHELPALLEGCLKNGFTIQEKVEAYKLLTMAYIYLEEPAKADEALLKLLQTDSYFEINPATDPAEFIALYKTFRTWPIYKIGGKVGANASSPNVVQSIEANDGKSVYNYKVGFQAHLAFEIPLTKSLVISPEIGLMQRNFNYTNTVSFSDTTFITKVSEKQNWISLPISIQYQFSKLKFKPFIGVGIQSDYLLGSSLTGERTRKGYQPVESKTFNVNTQREKFNESLIASAGAHFKLGGGLILAEIRFVYGLTNVNSAAKAFSIDNSLPFQYGYADSVFKLNSLSFTVGYVYNVFHPKKLKAGK